MTWSGASRVSARSGLVTLCVALAVAMQRAAFAQSPPNAPTNLQIVEGSPATTFHVSPAGSDTKPGTSALPFRTIERARDAVRAINGSMTSDILVYVHDGVYELPTTLVFDQTDSGTNGFRVVYVAAPGERPVLSGGQGITGRLPVENGIYKASVGTLRFRQLYVNGVRGVRARAPNVGDYYQLRSWDTANRRVEIASNEIANWQRLNQVEMVIQKHWYQNNLRVASFSVSRSSAFVVPAEPERTRSFTQTFP